MLSEEKSHEIKPDFEGSMAGMLFPFFRMETVRRVIFYADDCDLLIGRG